MFDRIIRKVLAKSAGDRYARCQELADDLEAAVSEWREASDRSHPPTQVSKTRGVIPEGAPPGGLRGITFLAPVVVDLALKFGPADYFSLMMLAFVTVSAVLGSSAVRGLTSSTRPPT